MFFDNLRGGGGGGGGGGGVGEGKSQLIRSKSLNIRSKIWRKAQLYETNKLSPLISTE